MEWNHDAERMEEVKAAEQLEGDETRENAALEPQLMEINGMGEVLVGGDPFGIADKLDDSQGDNVLNAQGDCGLVSVANILTQAGCEITEDEVVITAVGNRLCLYSTDMDPAENGGTNVYWRQALLQGYGIPCTVYEDGNGGKLNPESIAELVEAGHGVNISVNAGYAWNDANYINDGSSNHSIIVTGTVRDPETGELRGLVVCDSGLPDKSSAKVLTMDVLQDAYVDARGASALVTDRPICG